LEILKRYLDKYLVVLWIRLTFGKKIIAPTESIIKYVRTIAIATGFPITRDARIKSVIVPISAPIMKGIAFLRVKSLEIAKGTRSPIVMLELKKRAVIPNPTKKAFFGLEKYFFKKFLVCSLPPKADIIDLEKNLKLIRRKTSAIKKDIIAEEKREEIQVNGDVISPVNSGIRGILGIEIELLIQEVMFESSLKVISRKKNRDTMKRL